MVLSTAQPPTAPTFRVRCRILPFESERFVPDDAILALSRREYSYEVNRKIIFDEYGSNQADH